jgi:hypothetical protein
MSGDYQPVRETVATPINHGDPNVITQCTHCGYCYRNGEPVNKPLKSWPRVVLENLWRYRWQTDMTLGSTIPIGYGISWFHQNSLTMAVHPIPFNVIMRTLRDLAFWAMRGGWMQFPSVKDKIDHEVAKRLPYSHVNTRLLDALSNAVAWNDEYKKINHLSGDPYWVAGAKRAIAVSTPVKTKSEWP